MNPAALADFLHTPQWEAFLKESGQTVERDGSSLYIRGALPKGGSYWRSSRLEIPANWHPPQFTKDAWFIRIEPTNPLPDQLKKHGAVRATHSVQPKQTLVVDITQREEDILSQMKSKHRYNIRVAERHEVQVNLFHRDCPEQFERFWKLLEATAERHTFRTHTKEYYEKMLQNLAPHDMIHLGIASVQGADVAGAIFITHDKTCTYLHGGSNHLHREAMAPYLLHWQTMQWAKATGYEVYDFWGTNAVQNNDRWEARTNHASTGTTRFKLGFGGQVIQYPGAFDLVLKPIPYTLYNGIRRVLRRQSNF
jgi:peptidoglycan pentaglycine glycine transferase (the first glycine)